MASENELDQLVEIRTWDESCYEFSHFTNEELADGIIKVHSTINGLSRDALIQALAVERGRGKDIKEAWSQWERRPSKVELAHTLWPILESKIELCKLDSDTKVPAIAAVMSDAYHIAQRWRYPTFVLGEESAEG